MAHKKTGTSYSLIPAEPREIISCAVVAVTSVAVFFSIIHIVAFITRVIA